MTDKPPSYTPEKKQITDDNARKFIAEAIDTQFLADNNASSYVLTVDWLETAEDSEQKIAHKEFDNGDVQILLISKVTKDDSRLSEKEAIDPGKYRQLLGSSILHLKKKRYEFEYLQNNTPFSMKYDEFVGSDLRMLEVDASSDQDTILFDSECFPAKVTEVSGDTRYYGYRVVGML